MKISAMKPFPPNTNPFIHDAYNMGTKLGTNVTVMYANFPSDVCKSLIIVNTETGERFMIDFTFEDKSDPFSLEGIKNTPEDTEKI